jgi:ArsR family transcriptional regulator
MEIVDQRLRRLIKSDICQAENAEEYKEELIQLTQDVANVEAVKKQSRFFKALSNQKRLQILKLLRVREMCVCELMIALNMTQPNLSHHLRILENVAIINRTKKGKWVYCSLVNREIIENMRKIDIL